jgi:hypothetical protein
LSVIGGLGFGRRFRAARPPLDWENLMSKVLGRNVRAAALAGAALCFGGAASVQAAVLLYEPFDYPVTNDTNNRGLTGVNGNAYTASGGYVAPNGRTWQPTGYGTAATNNLLSANYDKVHDAVIVSPGLSVPGLSPGVGNAVSYGGPGYTPRLDVRATADAAGDITPAQGGIAYYSMAFRITDITGLQPVGGTIAAFNNSVGQQAQNPTVLAGRTLIRADPAGSGGYQIGLIKAQDGTSIFDPTVHSLSEQQFVVVKYDFEAASTSDDVATMWINPDPSTFGGADPGGGTIINNPNGTDIGSNVIRSIILRQGNIATNANPAGVIADELRVGTSYADVTPIPEPASAAALGIAALAALGVRRRRA